MPAKQFRFHADARQSILRGAMVLADAVRVTLGPKSKYVLIEKKFGRPIVCDEGATIAQEVELKNPDENPGAQMVREAAERRGNAVGDGTTSATLLAHAILVEGVGKHGHRRQRGGLEALSGTWAEGGHRDHPIKPGDRAVDFGFAAATTLVPAVRGRRASRSRIASDR